MGLCPVEEMGRYQGHPKLSYQGHSSLHSPYNPGCDSLAMVSWEGSTAASWELRQDFKPETSNPKQKKDYQTCISSELKEKDY